jgi:hypothetical protein
LGRGEGGRQTIRSLDEREMTIIVAWHLCKSDIFSHELQIYPCNSGKIFETWENIQQELHLETDSNKVVSCDSDSVCDEDCYCGP